MAKRKSRKNMPARRSSRRKAFNIAKAAEMYLTTNVLTQNFAGVNPISFVTGVEYGATGSTGGMKGGRPVMGFSYNPSLASVTMPELLGFGSATVGQGTQTLVDNFKANAFNAGIQYLGVKVGFKIGSRLLSSQRSFINNDIIKPLLGKNMVRV